MFNLYWNTLQKVVGVNIHLFGYVTVSSFCVYVCTHMGVHVMHGCAWHVLVCTHHIIPVMGDGQKTLSAVWLSLTCTWALGIEPHLLSLFCKHFYPLSVLVSLLCHRSLITTPITNIFSYFLFPHFNHEGGILGCVKMDGYHGCSYKARHIYDLYE